MKRGHPLLTHLVCVLLLGGGVSTGGLAQNAAAQRDPLAVVESAPASASVAFAASHSDELANSAITAAAFELAKGLGLALWLDPLKRAAREQLGLEPGRLEEPARGGLVGVYRRDDGGVGAFAEFSPDEIPEILGSLRAVPRTTQGGLTVQSIANGRAELSVTRASGGRQRVLLATAGWLLELAEPRTEPPAEAERAGRSYVAALRPRDLAMRLTTAEMRLSAAADVDGPRARIRGAVLEPRLATTPVWDAALLDALAGQDAAYAIGQSGRDEGFGPPIRAAFGLDRLGAGPLGEELLGELVLVAAHAGDDNDDRSPTLAAAVRLTDDPEAMTLVDAAMAGWLSPTDPQAADFGGRFPEAVRSISIEPGVDAAAWPGRTLAWTGQAGGWLGLASTEDRARAGFDALADADRPRRDRARDLGSWRTIGTLHPGRASRFAAQTGRADAWLALLSNFTAMSWRARVTRDGTTLVDLEATASASEETAGEEATPGEPSP